MDKLPVSNLRQSRIEKFYLNCAIAEVAAEKINIFDFLLKYETLSLGFRQFIADSVKKSNANSKDQDTLSADDAKA